MEHTWNDAAQTGNIDALYGSFRLNPNLFEDIDKVPFIDTPMHIAASAGQTDFAIEVMSLKPSFSRKLNPDGMSPLDLALRNRHFPTVDCLVKDDPELVRVKGRGKITPVHYAAEVDDIDRLEAFVSICPESVEDLTIGRETPVHIAVRKGHARAVKVLLDCVERNRNEKVLDWLDCRGNTILHIAAAANDFEVVKMLLEKVDINIKNLDGLTAINLAGDQRIIDILDHEESLRSTPSKPKKSWLTRLIIRFLLGSLEDISSWEQINALLVIAALIATATYQSMLSPPGGSFSGDESLKKYRIGYFMSFNSVAFISSIAMIWLLLTATNDCRLLKVSLFFLVVSYGLGFCDMAPFVIVFLVYCCLFFLLFLFVMVAQQRRFKCHTTKK